MHTHLLRTHFFDDKFYNKKYQVWLPLRTVCTSKLHKSSYIMQKSLDHVKHLQLNTCTCQPHRLFINQLPVGVYEKIKLNFTSFNAPAALSYFDRIAIFSILSYKKGFYWCETDAHKHHWTVKKQQISWRLPPCPCTADGYFTELHITNISANNFL